jgi:hypothetical protein
MFGELQLCAHGEVSLQQPRDRTAGFGSDSGPDEIALLRPGRLGQNVKLNARDGPPHRQLFHRNRDGGSDALRGTPGAGEFIRERRGKAGRMGGGDEFIGVSSLSFLIAGHEVLALRKGTAPRGDHAFSALEITNPSGRGVWFHRDRFRDEKGPDAPENKWPPSRLRTLAHRTTVTGVFIRSQPSRFRRDCANTLFLGFE